MLKNSQSVQILNSSLSRNIYFIASFQGGFDHPQNLTPRSRILHVYIIVILYVDRKNRMERWA